MGVIGVILLDPVVKKHKNTFNKYFDLYWKITTIKI